MPEKGYVFLFFSLSRKIHTQFFFPCIKCIDKQFLLTYIIFQMSNNLLKTSNTSVQSKRHKLSFFIPMNKLLQSTKTKFTKNYCERGAIPLAFPKWCPATTTGIPWFPAATEAVCLYITDTTEGTFSGRRCKISKFKFCVTLD